MTSSNYDLNLIRAELGALGHSDVSIFEVQQLLMDLGFLGPVPSEAANDAKTCDQGLKQTTFSVESEPASQQADSNHGKLAKAGAELKALATKLGTLEVGWRDLLQPLSDSQPYGQS
jgi:hypothetical protein